MRFKVRGSKEEIRGERHLFPRTSNLEPSLDMTEQAVIHEDEDLCGEESESGR
jgi:hypothetical protein